MQVKCEIYKVDIQTGLAEELGLVNVEKALEIFANFDWESELAKKTGYTTELKAPNFVLIDEANQRQLDIATSDNVNFHLHYQTEKEHSNFVIYGDANKNTEGWTVEEFIVLFFENRIEEFIVMDDTAAMKEAIENLEPDYATSLKAYRESISKTDYFEFNTRETNYVAFLKNTLIWLAVGAGIFLVTWDKIWFINVIFSITWLPGIVLHFIYYFKNYNTRLIIDKAKNEITYINAETETKFRSTQIAQADIFSCKNTRMAWYGYSYLLLRLTDGTKLIFTCYLIDPVYFCDILYLSYKDHEESYPIL